MQGRDGPRVLLVIAVLVALDLDPNTALGGRPARRIDNDGRRRLGRLLEQVLTRFPAGVVLSEISGHDEPGLCAGRRRVRGTRRQLRGKARAGKTARAMIFIGQCSDSRSEESRWQCSRYFSVCQ